MTRLPWRVFTARIPHRRVIVARVVYSSAMSYTIPLPCGCTAYVSCWPDSGIAHTRIIELRAPGCRIRNHERGARVYLWEMLPHRSGIGNQEITMAADRPASGARARV